MFVSAEAYYYYYTLDVLMLTGNVKVVYHRPLDVTSGF
jgi:hypothetical protein